MLEKLALSGSDGRGAT